jgi:hypothetical protein
MRRNVVAPSRAVRWESPTGDDVEKVRSNGLEASGHAVRAIDVGGEDRPAETEQVACASATAPSSPATL